VILEGNVFQTPKINDPVMKKLEEAQIDAVFASDAFTFTHMKMWIIDDEWCVSTGNWSYTSFTKNREFIFCSNDESILHSLEEIFLSDFLHKRPLFSGT
jgi:phosphatidylserine/phosphatidylglycerophosphate/cardiolipin synthase-like enzyme